MGSKWVIQLPTLNVNVMLYVLCKNYLACCLFHGPDFASLGFICRLAFTGILIGEILAPTVPTTPDYPPSQMAPEIGTRPDPHFVS